MAASLGYRFSPRFSARLTAGAILGGTLDVDDRSFDVEPGWLVTASASASFAATEETGVADPGTVDLIATDGRIGVLFGTTVGDRVSPYLLGRAFAGPVLWEIDGEDRTGSDAHHYQVGAGASISLPANVSAQLDVSFLGERSLSAGGAVAF